MSFFKTKLKIKNLEIPRFMSAPIDGITDSPMRQLIRECSEDELLFTEMRHVASIVHEQFNQSLKFKDIERPLCFQFAANSTLFIEEATKKVLAKNFELLNLNACCPAKNVIKSGGGSFLMSKPQMLKKIIKTFTKTIDGKVPFTIKIRAGFKEKNAVEISKLAEGEGVDAIIIHPRTQAQGFAGLPDIELVEEIKKKIKIPIIYSGNITSFEDAEKVYTKTNADGFMIGRALYGAPWKLKEITQNSLGKTFSIDLKTTLRYALKHLDLVVEHYGEPYFQNIKKQLPAYIKAIQNASQTRKKLIETQNANELKEELEKLIKNE